MSRKKKNKKKKNRKNNNRSGGGGRKTVTEKAETTGDAPEKTPGTSPESATKAAEAAAELAETVSTTAAVAEPKPLPLDAPMDVWPVLQDRGTDPIKFDYDHGGVPLFLLMIYLAFLGMTFTYIASWLIPDYLAYFSG